MKLSRFANYVCPLTTVIIYMYCIVICSVPYILLFMYWLAVVNNINVTVLCSSILFLLIVIAFRCIVVGCAVHIMVLVSPQSECVGWYKWTPATTAVHNLRNAWCVTQSVEYQRLIWYKEKVMHMHTAHGRRTQQPSHTHVSN